jgi:hypothetical protein
MRRRDLLGSFGGLAVAQMLGQEGGAPHHTPRAKRVIQIFLSGAASQCDSFDYKPKLIEKAGLPWDPGEKV